MPEPESVLPAPYFRLDTSTCYQSGQTLHLWQLIADSSAVVVGFGDKKELEKRMQRKVIGAPLGQEDLWRYEAIDHPQTVALFRRILGDRGENFLRISQPLQPPPTPDSQRLAIMNRLAQTIFGLGKQLSSSQLDRLLSLCEQMFEILEEEVDEASMGQVMRAIASEN